MWAGFTSAHARGDEWLVRVAPSETFDALPADKRMRRTVEGDRVAVDLAEGRVAFSLDAVQGQGRSQGQGPPRDAVVRPAVATGRDLAYAIQNLLLPLVATALPSREAWLVHAAAIVVDGEAHVLVGPEGAGKTTWCRLAHDAGIPVVSDDLVVLEAARGRAWVWSAPVRRWRDAPMPPARWPLRAVWLPRHGTEASLETCSRLRAAAALASNLPYAGYGDGRGESDAPERVLEAVDRGTLVFARDRGFVDALRARR